MSVKEVTGAVIPLLRADSPYYGAIDLIGMAEVTVEITDVQEHDGESLAGKNVGKFYSLGLAKDGKPASKRLVLNKTNSKVIASMHGAQAKGWKGKSITLYTTTTKLKGDTVDCIRVKRIQA